MLVPFIRDVQAQFWRIASPSLLAWYVFACAFGWIWIRLPGTINKNVISIFLCLVSSVWLYDVKVWLSTIICSVAVALLLRNVPTKWIRPVAIAYVLAHFFTVVYYFNYLLGERDWQLPQMILTHKLIALVFNFHDGHREDRASVTSAQRAVAVSDVPSIFDVVSYGHFYPSYTSGPFCEYVHWKRHVNGNTFDDKILKGKEPSTVFPAIVCLGRAMLCQLIGLVLDVIHPPSTPLRYTFAEHSLMIRLLLIWPVMYNMTFRYASYMIYAESAMVSCGIAYNGVEQEQSKKDSTTTPRLKWDKFNGQNIIAIHTARTGRDAVGNWDISVIYWLRHYVYYRVPSIPAGSLWHKLDLQVLVTFLACAAWHGFSFGYVNCSIIMWMYVTVSRDFYRLFKRATVVPFVSGFAAWLFTNYFLSYAMVAYIFNSAEMNLYVFGNVYWLGHIVLFVLLVALKLLQFSQTTSQATVVPSNKKTK